MPAKIIQLSPAFPPGTRLPEIDRLKGLALILVILNHANGALGVNDWSHGEVGVDIFIILSGFTLALNSTALSAREFFQRRFLRIYPAYWAALALFLFGNAWIFADHRPAADIWLHLAGLHAFARPGYFSSINDSFWFISIIVLLYVVFFFLRRHLHDLALVAGTGALLTAAICEFYLRTGNLGALLHLGVRLPDLFIGLIAGQLASGRKAEVKVSAPLVAGLLAIGYLTVYVGINFGDPLGGVAWIALFLWADRLLMQSPAAALFAQGFGWLGLYSYEVYLLHQPLIRDYDRHALAVWWQVMQPTRGEYVASIVGALVFVFFLSVWLHRATDFLFRSVRRTSVR
jgi:peptidoglycan/LPS O-acetylase OafA/YrhL